MTLEEGLTEILLRYKHRLRSSSKKLTRWLTISTYHKRYQIPPFHQQSRTTISYFQTIFEQYAAHCHTLVTFRTLIVSTKHTPWSVTACNRIYTALTRSRSTHDLLCVVATYKLVFHALWNMPMKNDMLEWRIENTKYCTTATTEFCVNITAFVRRSPYMWVVDWS